MDGKFKRVIFMVKLRNTFVRKYSSGLIKDRRNNAYYSAKVS